MHYLSDVASRSIIEISRTDGTDGRCSKLGDVSGTCQAVSAGSNNFESAFIPITTITDYCPYRAEAATIHYHYSLRYLSLYRTSSPDNGPRLERPELRGNHPYPSESSSQMAIKCFNQSGSNTRDLSILSVSINFFSVCAQFSLEGRFLNRSHLRSSATVKKTPGRRGRSTDTHVTWSSPFRPRAGRTVTNRFTGTYAVYLDKF